MTKIRSVEATWLQVPIPEARQHTSDFGRMRSFDTVLVRIETEDGLVGHGEAKAGVGNLGDGRALVTLIRDELGSLLVGQDARRIAGQHLSHPRWSTRPSDVGGREAFQCPGQDFGRRGNLARSALCHAARPPGQCRSGR